MKLSHDDPQFIEDQLDRDYEREPQLGRDRRRIPLTRRGAVRVEVERQIALAAAGRSS